MNPEDFLTQADLQGMRRKLKAVNHISPTICIINKNEYIDFSSNNYLALANHPNLIKESIKWTEKFGTGSTASRLVSGTFSEYLELEDKIAEWKGTESALIIGSGYMANVGVISALSSNRKSVICADKLNHASLNTGAALTQGKFKRYPHLNFKKLEMLLTQNENEKIIVSDTVFSMDGDICNIKKLKCLSDKFNALLYLDDAHATGIFGEKGEGLAGREADIAMGTFSKAMGSYGAYIACSKTMKDYLINKCGSFIYSTALPPGVYGAISAAVTLVQTNEYKEKRKDLSKKSSYLKTELQKLGLNTGNTTTPIIPIIVGDIAETMKMSEYLMKNGIFVIPIRPPTVPAGTARLRVSINTAHSYSQINKLLDLLSQYKSKL
jgi:8-amino-7-oxononanoate synthase